MSAPVADAILAELWVSFVSMLRSYAGAAALNGGAGPEVEAAEFAVVVTAGGARLTMDVDAAGGQGKWSLAASQGSFVLLPEGRIAVDGKTLDLDHAALDFLALLTEAAAGSSAREQL